MNDGNHGQGTHSAKMRTASSAENTPKFIRQSAQKVWNIVEKRPHRASVVCGPVPSYSF